MSDDQIIRRFEAVAELIREVALAGEERHDREMAEIREEIRKGREELRRAIRLGIEEARAERRRRREGDDRLDSAISKLAAAQLVTEEKLQRFIDSMRRGGNGSA